MYLCYVRRILGFFVVEFCEFWLYYIIFVNMELFLDIKFFLEMIV